MPNFTAREMLARLPVRMADGGELDAPGVSAAYRKAMETGGQRTVEDYYGNLRRDAAAYLANPNAPTGADAYNILVQSGISTSDLKNAGVADAVLNKIFTVTLPAGQTTATGQVTPGAPIQYTTPADMTSAYTRSPDLMNEAQRLTGLGQSARTQLDKQGYDYVKNLQQGGIDANERAQMLEYATERGYTFDDLRYAGVDPSVLFNQITPAAKPYVKPPPGVTPPPPPPGGGTTVTPGGTDIIPGGTTVTPFKQTQTTYTAPTVYQPLPLYADIYAAGQPALDVDFRNSAPRTAIPNMPGYFDYTPAAKLKSATGAGYTWTPPSVTSRPRSLLSPSTIKAYGGLESASQKFARERAASGAAGRAGIETGVRAAVSQLPPALQNLSTYNQLRNRLMSQEFGDPTRALDPQTLEGAAFLAALEKLKTSGTTSDKKTGTTTGDTTGTGTGTDTVADSTTAGGYAESIEASPLTYGGYRDFYRGGFVKKSEGSAQEELARFANGGPVATGRKPLSPTDPLYIQTDAPRNPDAVARPIPRAAPAPAAVVARPTPKAAAPVAAARPAPMSQADLLAQIDRSTAATPSAITPERDPVKTESAGMLERLNASTPVEQEVYQMTGMEPGLNRAGILPIVGSRKEGNLGFGAPQFLYDAAKAAVSPGVAAQGKNVSIDDVLNTAMTFTGGSLGASQIAGPAAEAGTQMLGMAVKNKGGNWIGEGIDDGMGKLRVKNQGALFNTPASALEAMYERYTPEAIASLSPELARNVTNSIENLKAKSQIDKWIDTKLGKYIRNEMATEGDPIRALAERGVLHVNPDQAGVNRYREVRSSAGMPKLAVSDTAKAWENVSDAMINRMTAKDLLDSIYFSSKDGKTLFLDTKNEQDRVHQEFLDQNPWLTKLAPETNVYDLDVDTDATLALGFEHLIDELNNATRPDTDLPERLRIDYNKLDRMSVPQIVEKVADINSWRVENMSKANQALANNAATHFDLQLGLGNKTYPETGLRWAQLRMPDGETDPTTLQAALKYEGDTMGHCVGGYCDDVAANSTQIFSLRDAKGAPHVTIEVQPSEVPYAASGEAFARLSNAEKAQYREYIRAWRNRNPEVEDLTEENLYQALSEAGVPPNPPSIIQIKGKGNAAPAEKYLPAVQDFVRSRTWSDVGDLRNSGMRDLSETPALQKWMRAQNMEIPRYVTEREYRSLESDYLARQLGFAQGGYVTRKQDGGPVSPPMSNAELLAQIDRSTANSPAPATGTASSAPDREVTESRNMLERFTSLNTPQDMSLGETAADIAMGFAPVIGTAQGLRDFERARRDDDTLGMVLGAASALPIVGGAVKAARTVGKASKAASAPRNTKWLHGTNADFQEFDMAFAGKNFNDASSKEGVFLSAQRGNAKMYGDNIMEVQDTFKNPKIVNAEQDLYDDYLYLTRRGEVSGSFDDFINDFLEGDPYGYYEIGKLYADIKSAKSAGHDALIVDFGNLKMDRGGQFAVAFDPSTIKTITNPLVSYAQGGYITKKAKGGEVTSPPSSRELLAQIDRSTANSPAPATGTASSAPAREVTESQNMLRRLSDAFGQNVTAPVVGSMLDMTTGLGDLAQLGLKAGAGKLGIETKPFSSVSSRLQKELGVAGYDPYSPAALAASVLLPAAGPLRTAAAATRPMMSMAAAPGSARETLSLIKPILDREASVAASAELAAMAARKLAPDNATAEIAAAIAGGAGYNTLENIMGGVSRGPITSGMAADDVGDMVTMYHGSRFPVPLVLDEGMFGGVFASPSKQAAGSHGDVLNVTDIPKDKILTSNDLNYSINWEDTEPALMDAYDYSYSDLSDDQKAALVRAVIDDDAFKVDPDVLMKIMRTSDLGEALWEAQNIRGRLARNLGYSAVEMDDEHGLSYLILPGAKLKTEKYYDAALNAIEAGATTGKASKAAEELSDLAPKVYGTLKEAQDLLGITPEGQAAWRASRTGSKRTRVPEVKSAANSLRLGDISTDEYQAIARQFMPIKPLGAVQNVPTFEDIALSLSKDPNKSAGIVGVNVNIPDGTRIASRLDIPAYEHYDTWVVSLHDGTKKGGNAVGYGQTAVLNNVNFESSAKGALNIASEAKKPSGEKYSKSTIARMYGDWANHSAEDVQRAATSIFESGDPDWAEIGMNPDRHSYFYRKSDGAPIGSAEQVIQIGPLVLAKKVKTIAIDDPAHLVETPNGPIHFARGGVTKKAKGGNVERVYNDRKYI